MSDLTDYARRAAEERYPDDPRGGHRTLRANIYEDGIIHLAERLLEPDVIEAVAMAMMKASDGTPFWVERARETLTAMLDHIANGAE